MNKHSAASSGAEANKDTYLAACGGGVIKKKRIRPLALAERGGELF